MDEVSRPAQFLAQREASAYARGRADALDDLWRPYCDGMPLQDALAAARERPEPKEKQG